MYWFFCSGFHSQSFGLSIFLVSFISHHWEFWLLSSSPLALVQALVDCNALASLPILEYRGSRPTVAWVPLSRGERTYPEMVFYSLFCQRGALFSPLALSLYAIFCPGFFCPPFISSNDWAELVSTFFVEKGTCAESLLWEIHKTGPWVTS